MARGDFRVGFPFERSLEQDQAIDCRHPCGGREHPCKLRSRAERFLHARIHGCNIFFERFTPSLAAHRIPMKIADNRQQIAPQRSGLKAIGCGPRAEERF